MNLHYLVRENIKTLMPYTPARDEFTGKGAVYLDANENPYPSPYNRYPDPHQNQLKKIIAGIKGVKQENIFIGNGSDEAIDLLFRAFCAPGVDNVIIPQPTYGMYSVCAAINGIEAKLVSLNKNFDLDIAEIENSCNSNTKLLFLCSPNNPTGNLLSFEKVVHIIKNFKGLVVLDEAYIDFADSEGFLPHLNKFPNLAILQTLSKAWGLAGLRLGLCFASVEIINLLNRIKPPYNISEPSQQIAEKHLVMASAKESFVHLIKAERQKLSEALSMIKVVKMVFPSDANFILIRCYDSQKVFDHLTSVGIIVRNRSQQRNCEQCLRITVGTPAENKFLIDELKKYEKSTFY